MRQRRCKTEHVDERISRCGTNREGRNGRRGLSRVGNFHAALGSQGLELNLEEVLELLEEMWRKVGQRLGGLEQHRIQVANCNLRGGKWRSHACTGLPLHLSHKGLGQAVIFTCLQ